MHRIDGENTVAVLPTPEPAGTDGYFGDGDVGTGVPPTQVTRDWCNAVQEELVSVVQGSGQALSKTDVLQVWRALKGAYATDSDSLDIDGDTHNKRAIVAVTDCRATGADSAAVASTECLTSGAESAAVASRIVNVVGGAAASVASATGQVGGDLAALLASADVDVNADKSAAVAADTGQIRAEIAYLGFLAATLNVDLSTLATFCKVALASQEGDHTSSLAALIASKWVVLDKDLSVAGGWDPSGTPAQGNYNQTWRIESKDSSGGSAHGRAMFEGGTSAGPADYAEYFENVAPGVLAPGLLVAREGRRVRVAQPGDKVLGPVSAKPAVVGNAAPFEWAGRWQRDELGRPMTEDQQWLRAPGYDGPLATAPEPIPAHAQHRVKTFKEGKNEDAKVTEVPWVRWKRYDGPATGAPDGLAAHGELYETTVQAQSPDYDPEQAYVPREQRPEEWTCVGLLGQLPVAVDATVRVDDAVGAGPGGLGVRSSKATRLECMEILVPFDEARGYGVALCLVR